MRIGIIFLLLIPHIVRGGFERTQMGGRPVALGNAFVALGDDPWTITYNPAGLNQIHIATFSLFYSPQPFGVSELSTTAVAVLFPTSIGAIGGALRRQGFDLYREVSATFGYANTIRDVSIGINVNYHAVSIKSYGTSATIGLDAGLLIPLVEGLRWGASFKNVNAPSIGAAREPLPQSFITGVAYFPIHALTLVVDVQKESRVDLSPRFGFEYWLVDTFALRGGVSDAPSEISGGIGIRNSMLQFDYAFVSHPVLGATHQASVTFSWR
jgi:hypothetical protein